MPNLTTFVAGSSSTGWSCRNGAVAGTACTLALGTVPRNALILFSFAVRAPGYLAGPDRLVVNTVNVTDDGTHGPDLNIGDNRAIRNVFVVNGAVLARAAGAQQGADAGVQVDEPFMGSLSVMTPNDTGGFDVIDDIAVTRELLQAPDGIGMNNPADKTNTQLWIQWQPNQDALNRGDTMQRVRLAPAQTYLPSVSN